VGSKFGFQGGKVLKRRVSDGPLGRNLKTKLCKNLGKGYVTIMLRGYHNVCHYGKSFTIKMALVTIIFFYHKNVTIMAFFTIMLTIMVIFRPQCSTIVKGTS
jgi:hypothetical protein